MSVIEILNTTSSKPGVLRGCAIDKPAKGDRIEVPAIKIEGWAVAGSQPIEGLEVVCDDRVLGKTTADRKRPSVATRFPEQKALHSGFRVTISSLGLPAQSELALRVVLKNRRRVRIGTVEIKRERLQLGPSAMRPLMVTTLGRTGSTWLTHLLGHHPDIVCYRPFQYETRLANYWISVFKSLSEPHSYLHSLATNLSADCWWLGNREPSAGFPLLDPIIEKRLGSEGIQELAVFCRESISRFYQEVADLQGKREPLYFVEKASPGHQLQPLINELYRDARELLLVRDLRDMLCSILAYNKKRHMKGFGRQFAESDEAYVGRLRNSALTLARSWKSRSHTACLVRYEDLVQRPGETLQSIFQYLELPSTPVLVGKVLERAASEMSRAQKMHQTSRDPSASIGRWKRDLDARMKTACKEALNDILGEFGYEISRPMVHEA